MRKIDLHMHTTISDGTDDPEGILSKVSRAGIDLFSITDHDAIRAGETMPGSLTPQMPAFIRGVEFSCRDEKGKYHILGYGYDPAVRDIRDVVEKGHKKRMQKTRRRLRFLQEAFSFEFPQEEIEALLGGGNPGKPHIAKMMVKHGYAEDIDHAIADYINKREFENVHIRPEEAIEGILKSGGIPVLAHPPYGDGEDRIAGKDMDLRIRHLLAFGLKGVEAYYSGFTAELQAEILALADRYGLYVTAGSDYHGNNKPVALGDTNLEDIADAPAGLKRFLENVEILNFSLHSLRLDV